MEGEEVTLSVEASDVEKDQLVLKYAWDFGDQGAVADPISEPSTLHVFSDSGTFSVKLIVSDDDDGTSEQIISLEVGNLPPEITQLPESIEVEEGTPLNLLPVIVDAGQDDTHTLSWDFGD